MKHDPAEFEETLMKMVEHKADKEIMMYIKHLSARGIKLHLTD